MAKEELIEEANFSYGRLEEILQQSLDTKAQFTSWKSERIGLMQGFLSRSDSLVWLLTLCQI